MERASDPNDCSRLYFPDWATWCQRGSRRERDRWKDFRRTALECVLWPFMSMACIGWALHTTDVAYGKAAFFAGIAIGNGGVIFSLLAAYRRGEARGDW